MFTEKVKRNLGNFIWDQTKASNTIVGVLLSAAGVGVGVEGGVEENIRRKP